MHCQCRYLYSYHLSQTSCERLQTDATCTAVLRNQITSCLVKPTLVVSVLVFVCIHGPSVCLPVCLCVWLCMPACLPACLSVCVSVWLCLSVRPSPSPSIGLSAPSAPSAPSALSALCALSALSALSAWLAGWLAVCLSPSCPSVSVSVSVCRSVGLSVCRSVGLSVCRSVGLSVCRSVGLSVCRSVGLSVCLCLNACPSFSGCAGVQPGNRFQKSSCSVTGTVSNDSTSDIVRRNPASCACNLCSHWAGMLHHY